MHVKQEMIPQKIGVTTSTTINVQGQRVQRADACRSSGPWWPPSEAVQPLLQALLLAAAARRCATLQPTIQQDDGVGEEMSA